MQLTRKEMMVAATGFMTFKAFLMVLGFQGTIGFTSFVFEEAEQTCMFGGFGLSKDKDLAKMHIRHINKCFYIHDTAETWNNTLGWLYVFGFAYRNYQKANELGLCGNLYGALKKRGKKFKDAGELGARCKVVYATKYARKNAGIKVDMSKPEISPRLGNALD